MKQSLYIFFASLICLSSFSCTPRMELSPKGFPKWMKGEWKGIGLQLNFRQTWTIELEVSQKRVEVFYPTLDCVGEWILIESNDVKAVFVEKIVKGQNVCARNGKIIITLVDENHLSYSYYSSDKKILQAHSTLINKEIINAIRT